jgi:hypothetical protein
MADQTQPSKPQRRWRDRAKSLLLSTALGLVIYLLTGGKLDAQAGRQLLSVLLLIVFLGLPLFRLFRLAIGWLSFRTGAKGYWATAIGLALNFALLAGLVYLIPRNIGVVCLPLGLLGGIAGALEAKDRSLTRGPKAAPGARA